MSQIHWENQLKTETEKLMNQTILRWKEDQLQEMKKRSISKIEWTFFKTYSGQWQLIQRKTWTDHGLVMTDEEPSGVDSIITQTYPLFEPWLIISLNQEGLMQAMPKK